MPLSEEGIEQAKKAGIFLCRFFHENKLYDDKLFHARLWVSPYLRTRQTADFIEGEFRRMWLTPRTPLDSQGSWTDPKPGSWMEEPIFRFGRREHINLVEQQFGLFDGLRDEELPERYPDEHAHYKKCEDQEGKFWARMPLGESRFDLAVRVHQAFGTFKRDEEKHGITNIVVVAHGATLRAFTMQWLHYPYEWFEKEPNPQNCSIRLLEDDRDRGYIFEGFKSPRTPL